MAARDPLAEAMALMSAEPAPAPALAPAADPPAPPPAAGAAAVLTPDGVHGELSGRSWAGFAVGDLLGSGGMGEVYRAWQGSVGRAVALKVLHARSHDPVQRQRFIAEARAAGRVRSPQVVAVYDSGEQDGRLWLALEVVDGPTLAEELGRRRTAGGGFTPAETLRLMLQAASGLAAVHRARMVHRDLKPGNLLLDRDGGLHLGDFGLVRLLDERSLTLTGTVVGTPQYMAPEQGRGHAPGARADIYSLGAVMYELLTLRPPFSGTSADQLISQHNFTEPEPPGALAPGTPPELEAVCLTCLQKDPARRFADGTSLADDLARIHAGIAPVSTVRAHGRILTGADEAVRRLAGRRRQYLLASALLALLGLGLAGGWWWWDQRKVAVATLRDRLAPLLQPAAAPPTAGDDLDRLQTLAGPGDPLVASGRAKLAAVEAAAARLTALEGRPEPDPAAAGAALAALEALVGPAGHPGLPRWRAWAAAAAGRLDTLRARLAPRLDGAALLGWEARRDLGDDLAAFTRLAPPADPDRRRWQELLARTDAAIAEDRAALRRLGEPAPLRADELPGLAAALGRLAATAGPEAAGAAAARRLADETGELERRRQQHAQLLARAELGPRARSDLAATGAWLAERAALDPEDGRRARQRLDDLAAALAGLRERLAVLDAPRSVPADLDQVLGRYEALAGLEDGDGLRWRRRLEEVRALQRRLAPLDRPGPPPAQAGEDLAALAALVGGADPEVRRWSAALERLAAARERAEAIDRVGEPPAGAAEDLAAYAALVGADQPEVRRRQERLRTAEMLRARMTALAGALTLDADGIAAARADLAAWEALAGPGAPGARAAAHLAELAGPGRPAWAADAGHDRHGPWASLAAGGAVQRLRWVPPLAGTIGSPSGEEGAEEDERPLAVRLERGLWLADSECSQALWAAVMDAWPAAVRDPLLPVDQVSRADAERFCLALSQRLPGCVARLPEEREWELAARAGAAGPWGGLGREAAARAIAHRGTGLTPAGTSPPNPFGLRDMPGNVWEWCRGCYGAMGADGLVGQLAGAPGVVRGGGWRDPLEKCRPANRAPLDPGRRSPLVGFRFAIEP